MVKNNFQNHDSIKKNKLFEMRFPNRSILYNYATLQWVIDDVMLVSSVQVSASSIHYRILNVNIIYFDSVFICFKSLLYGIRAVIAKDSSVE